MDMQEIARRVELVVDKMKLDAEVLKVKQDAVTLLTERLKAGEWGPVLEVILRGLER
jgi:hypothetical protein